MDEKDKGSLRFVLEVSYAGSDCSAMECILQQAQDGIEPKAGTKPLQEMQKHKRINQQGEADTASLNTIEVILHLLRRRSQILRF